LPAARSCRQRSQRAMDLGFLPRAGRSTPSNSTAASRSSGRNPQGAGLSPRDRQPVQRDSGVRPCGYGAGARGTAAPARPRRRDTVLRVAIPASRATHLESSSAPRSGRSLFVTAPMVGAPASRAWLAEGGVMQLGTRLDPGSTRPSGPTAPAKRTSHGNSTGNQRQFKVISRSFPGQFKVNSTGPWAPCEGPGGAILRDGRCPS